MNTVKSFSTDLPKGAHGAVSLEFCSCGIAVSDTDIFVENKNVRWNCIQQFQEKGDSFDNV
jgi:hypothetical protein